MKKYIPLLGLLLIIQSSIAAEGINGETTVNQYNDFYQSWSYPQILENFVGGGGGSVSVNITNDLLTVSFSAGFSENKLKNGFVVSFTSSPALPNMELGFLNLKNGTTLYNNNVKVSIISNAIIFEHLAGHNNQVYSWIGSTFQVDLTTLGSGGNIGEMPSASQNYIMATIYQKGYTEAQIGNATDSEKISAVQYFDGLGRPLQTVGIRAGGANQDIITHIDYDSIGRQDKDYLPYAATSNGGAIRADALGSTNSFYLTAKYENTANPYSEKLFEASPLNRVLEQTAPGSSWKAGTIFDTNGHTDGNTIKFGNQTNITSEVRLYNVTLAFANNTYTPTLQNTTPYYAASQLYKTIIKDENWKTVDALNKTTEEFKDKQGRIILKRTYNVGQKHDTYYVYDDFGNLTYVLPPKMEASTATVATINSQLNELGYQYKYDHRNRLVEKRIPGKGTATDWEEIVFNKLDQPILTRDPNLKAQGRWLFTKYDVFGRVAYTGLITNGNSRAILQTAADSVNSQFVTKNAATTIAGTTIYYDNGAYPNVLTTDEIHTINYYDDYNFGVPAIPVNRNYTDSITSRTKGLATGSKVKVLGQTNIWITTTSYYDDKARPIYAKSINEYLGTTDIVESKLDFVGKVEKTKTIHNKTGQTPIITEDTFVYDHVGRLKSQTQTINGVNPETIAANTYDELGQLTVKGVGGKTSRLQTVNYAYNIRGWLKQINDPNNLGTDLFGFKINYNTVNHGATSLYNGNISETEWKTQNDNVLRWYNYGYDALNRITKGISNDGKFDLGSTTNPVTYDQNGNILSLYRKGAIVTNPVIGTSANYGVMDQLTYTYQANSNKLTIVSDTGNDTFGFKDDQIGTGTDTTIDYTYDVNGNMKTDTNKGITAITYNHLNLPTQVTMAGGNISYIYDATGVKLRKIVSTGTTTDYEGNYVYENGTLQFFNTTEGYVEPVNASDYNLGFNYVYQYKDHLGNIRLSYKDVSLTSTPSLQIVEENNYYPFGLKHKGYNTNIVSEHKYKYNGKELQSELDLNWYDLGARNLDHALGRFMNVDPKAEQYSFQSTYTFANNNPILFVDINGEGVDDWVERANKKIEWDDNVTSKNDKDLKKGETYLGKNVIVATHSRDASGNEELNTATFDLYLESDKTGSSATIKGNTVPSDITKSGTLAEGLYPAESGSRSKYVARGKEDLAILINGGNAVPTLNGNPSKSNSDMLTGVFFHMGNNYQTSLFDSKGTAYSSGCQTSGCFPNSRPLHNAFMNKVGTNFKGSYFLRSKPVLTVPTIVPYSSSILRLKQ